MRKRWIGAPNPDPENGVEDAGHDVLVAGHHLGTVKHGEVIDIPDELVAEVVDPVTNAVLVPAVVFPESLWEDARDVRPAKRETKGEG